MVEGLRTRGTQEWVRVLSVGLLPKGTPLPTCGPCHMTVSSVTRSLPFMALPAQQWMAEKEVLPPRRSHALKKSTFFWAASEPGSFSPSLS